MSIRPISFRRLPRGIQSAATTEIRHACFELFSQFLHRTCGETVKQVLLQASSIRVGELLDKYNLRRLLDIGQWFEGLEPAFTETPRNKEEVLALANLAEEYADLQGAWADAAEHLDAACDEALREIESIVPPIAQEIAGKYGLLNARKVLQALIDEFERRRGKVQQQHTEGQTSGCEELKRTAERLRTIASAKGARKAISLLTGGGRLWAKPSDVEFVEQAADYVNRVAQERHGLLLRQVKQRLYDQLLETPQETGFLTDQMKGIANPQEIAARIVRALPTPLTPSVSTGTSLLLFESIDVHVDGPKSPTIYQVFHDQARLSGWSVESFVSDLNRRGLTIQGRKTLPGQWHKCPPAVIAQALYKRLRIQLGAGDVSAGLNTERPKTPLEYIAAADLLFPVFQPALMERLRKMETRTQPFLELPEGLGRSAQVHTYMFCAPWHRDKLEQLLPNIGFSQSSDGFDLQHGQAMCLTRFASGYAGFAQLAFIRGRCRGIVRASRGDRRLDLLELRHEDRAIHVREDGHADSRELFEALRLSGSVQEIEAETTRYVLGGSDPSVKRIFWDCEIVPLWQTAKHFHQLLRSKIFTSFVDVHLPGIAGWSKLSATLAEQREPRSAAQRLVNVGVLRSDGEGLFAMEGRPPTSMLGVPCGTYAEQFGDLRGLTQREFTEELLDNDWFYNVCFWRVNDAIDVGSLALSQAPQFANWYRSEVLS